jgi:hypothetical protein
MSNTIKGQPKLGNVPSWFKRLQSRSQKQKQKESDRELFSSQEGTAGANFKKSHKWDWF